MSDINKSRHEWKQQLTTEQYHVTREKGTEKPFSGAHNNNKDAGIYACVCCGKNLFSSKQKYDSGSGWPSYWQPINDQCVSNHVDHYHGMRRVEVRCSGCDAHLGHVFEDGPVPTGLRYCINSIALEFKAGSLELRSP